MKEFGSWFYYLTNLTYALFVLHVGLQAYFALQAYRARDVRNLLAVDTRLTRFAVLHHQGVFLGELIVVSVFYAVLCNVGCIETASPVSAVVHGVNFAYLLLDFVAINRLHFVPAHVAYAASYGTSYAVWSFIVQLSSPTLMPVYFITNWVTGIAFVVVPALLVVMTLLHLGLSLLSSRCLRPTRARRDGVDFHAAETVAAAAANASEQPMMATAASAPASDGEAAAPTADEVGNEARDASHRRHHQHRHRGVRR